MSFAVSKHFKTHTRHPPSMSIGVGSSAVHDCHPMQVMLIWWTGSVLFADNHLFPTKEIQCAFIWLDEIRFIFVIIVQSTGAKPIKSSI